MAIATDTHEVLVLDMGSGWSKTGYAGSEEPSFVFPTVVAMSREGVLIGDQVPTAGEDVKHHHPVEKSVVFNPVDIDNLLHHTFEGLEVEPSEHPVMISEPAVPSVPMRSKLAECIFETYGCEGFLPYNHAFAALLSAGRTTGTVVNCGAGAITSLPINEGSCCSFAMYSKSFGGIEVIKKFKQDRPGGFFFWEKLFHKVGFVAHNSESRAVETVSLPDGQQVSLGDERFDCLENILKGPKGLAEGVCESIATSEEDYGVRQTFFQNLLLTGGLTKTANLRERFLSDITEFSPTEFEVEVVLSGMKGEELSDPMYNTWNGGSILALMSLTSAKFVTREEFDEAGNQALSKLNLFDTI